MAVYFEDTFTGSGTIDGHVAESGDTWALDPFSDPMTLSGGNVTCPGGSSFPYATVNFPSVTVMPLQALAELVVGSGSTGYAAVSLLRSLGGGSFGQVASFEVTSDGTDTVVKMYFPGEPAGISSTVPALDPGTYSISLERTADDWSLIIDDGSLVAMTAPWTDSGAGEAFTRMELSLDGDHALSSLKVQDSTSGGGGGDEDGGTGTELFRDNFEEDGAWDGRVASTGQTWDASGDSDISEGFLKMLSAGGQVDLGGLLVGYAQLDIVIGVSPVTDCGWRITLAESPNGLDNAIGQGVRLEYRGQYSGNSVVSVNNNVTDLGDQPLDQPSTIRLAVDKDLGTVNIYQTLPDEAETLLATGTTSGAAFGAFGSLDLRIDGAYDAWVGFVVIKGRAPTATEFWTSFVGSREIP